MQQKKIYIILIVLIVSFNACRSDKGKNIPDVSNIKINLSVNHFEKSLFSLDTNHLKKSLTDIEKEHPIFTDLFFTRVIRVKNPRDTSDIYRKQLAGFINDERIQKLKDTVDIVYGDFAEIEKEFKQAFKFYKHYFPKKEIPNLYTFIAEYSYGNFIFPDENGKDGIGIGLDMFLGADYPYRLYNPNNPVFSDYNTRSFNKDHLVKKSLDALIDDLLGPPRGKRLLDIMIHNGKALYILDQLLPFAPDSVRLEYSQKQMDWIDNDANEQQIWAHFLGEDLLYSTESKKIRKLVHPSPHSPGMPPEAPGRTANWMGWQIIKAYMKRNPETNLEELIGLDDAQKILNKSKYKPPR